MLMCTLCGYKVPYSTLCVRFCPFSAPVAMPSPPKVLLRQRWFRWSNRLSDLRKYQWPAEPLCNLVIQHLTQTDVPEMLIPQILFHLGLPVLTCLPFAAQPKRPVPTARAGGRCPPSSWAQSLHCWQPNTKRRKKNHCIHTAKRSSGLPESAVFSSLIITTQTGRAGAQTNPQAQGAAWVRGITFGCLLHLENTSLQRCKAGTN